MGQLTSSFWPDQDWDPAQVLQMDSEPQCPPSWDLHCIPAGLHASISVLNGFLAMLSGHLPGVAAAAQMNSNRLCSSEVMEVQGSRRSAPDSGYKVPVPDLPGSSPPPAFAMIGWVSNWVGDSRLWDSRHSLRIGPTYPGREVTHLHSALGGGEQGAPDR